MVWPHVARCSRRAAGAGAGWRRGAGGDADLWRTAAPAASRAHPARAGARPPAATAAPGGCRRTRRSRAISAAPPLRGSRHSSPLVLCASPALTWWRAPAAMPQRRALHSFVHCTPSLTKKHRTVHKFSSKKSFVLYLNHFQLVLDMFNKTSFVKGECPSSQKSNSLSNNIWRN